METYSTLILVCDTYNFHKPMQKTGENAILIMLVWSYNHSLCYRVAAFTKNAFS